MWRWNKEETRYMAKCGDAQLTRAMFTAEGTLRRVATTFTRLSSSLNVVASEKGVVVGRLIFDDDGDNIAVTDNGNYIVDLEFADPLADAPAAAAQLKATCGVVDHGIFIGMTTAVIIAGEAGISVKTP